MADSIGATALLLIDLQTAFCGAEGSMARQGRDISGLQLAASRCGALVELARRYAIPVIWTRMLFRADYADGGLLTDEIRPNLKRIGALRAGTPDVELIDGLGRLADDVVIDKPRYSALYATPLEAVLRARRIDRVIVAGVTTAMCVESTVRDLGQRDWRVVVVRDACAEFEPSRHLASLAAMEFGFAQVCDAAELPARLPTRGV